MAEPLDAEEVIRRSPAVDAKQLQDLGSALRSLRNQGIKEAGYNLAPPFTRRQSSPPEDDPRAIRLRP